ncbi:hypothetical protein HZB60_03700 [candidate division KSB1 bacterium]|nr:hypothetical protein [candidate division KSB1 bacterium]
MNRGSAVPSNFESFRRQAAIWIQLSLLVMAALMAVHVGFTRVMGYPSQGLVILFAARFIEQLGELVWLQNLKSPLSESAMGRYLLATVILGVGFAFAASMLSNVQESHYAALMVLPIIVAAASHAPLWITLLTVGVSGCLTIFQVWYFYWREPHLTEYYEAATVVLIYVVVALVVHLLVTMLRHREQVLEQSVAELAQTQDRLVVEEKLAAVGRLASAIAHEIRNPVSTISSSLESASSESCAPGLRDELLGIARNEAHRMEVLTTDFLSYARQRPPELRRTQLALTLDYVRDVVQGYALAARVRIETICAQDDAFTCDPFQIYQALINLTRNAIDASSPDSAIVLRAERKGQAFVFGIENAGEPVPDDVLHRIFEPFFTTKSSGTGLGLAIARKIAEGHGGSLELVSNLPGQIRFELTIPNMELA